jgi:hypothetical protein
VTFYSYLLLCRGDGTPAGDFAKDALADTARPSLVGTRKSLERNWFRHLDRRDACDAAYAGFIEAIDRWKSKEREIKRSQEATP